MGVALHFSDCHIAFYRHGLQFGGQLLVVGVSLLSFFFLFTPLPHVFFIPSIPTLFFLSLSFCLLFFFFFAPLLRLSLSVSFTVIFWQLKWSAAAGFSPAVQH